MKLHKWLVKMIGNEVEASEVYERIAQKSEPEIADIAMVFKDEELRHVEMIKGVAEDFKESEIVLTPQTLSLPALKVKDSVSGEKELSFMNRKELFLFALKGEKESIELYGELEKIFEKGSKEQELFGKLADEERNHMFFVLQQLHEL